MSMPPKWLLISRTSLTFWVKASLLCSALINLVLAGCARPSEMKAYTASHSATFALSESQSQRALNRFNQVSEGKSAVQLEPSGDPLVRVSTDINTESTSDRLPKAKVIYQEPSPEETFVEVNMVKANFVGSVINMIIEVQAGDQSGHVLLEGVVSPETCSQYTLNSANHHCADLKDPNVAPDKKYHLRGMAVCLDDDNTCKSFYVDIFYKIDGELKKKQFIYMAPAQTHRTQGEASTQTPTKSMKEPISEVDSTPISPPSSSEARTASHDEFDHSGEDALPVVSGQFTGVPVERDKKFRDSIEDLAVVKEAPELEVQQEEVLAEPKVQPVQEEPSPLEKIKRTIFRRARPGRPRSTEERYKTGNTQPSRRSWVRSQRQAHIDSATQVEDELSEEQEPTPKRDQVESPQTFAQSKDVEAKPDLIRPQDEADETLDVPTEELDEAEEVVTTPVPEEEIQETSMADSEAHQVTSTGLDPLQVTLTINHLFGGESLFYPFVHNGQPGRLHGAPEFKPTDGPGYRKIRLDKGLNYASGILEGILKSASRAMREQLGYSANELVIGDLSQAGGGSNSGHRSHQNGVDADIAYLNKDGGPHTFWQVLNGRGGVKGEFDFERNWDLFQLLVSTGYTQYIFVNHKIKKAFCDWAKPRGYLDTELGRETMTRLYPIDYHSKHFHLRVKCSPFHIKCLDQPEPVSTGC